MSKSSIFKLLVSFSLLYYLISIFDFELLSTISIDIIPLFLFGVLFLAIALLMMSIRWRILSGYNDISNNINLIEYYKLYFIGSFFNIFFPGGIGGDLVRIKYFTNLKNIKIKESTAIVIKERVFGVVALFLLLLVGTVYSINEIVKSDLNIISLKMALPTGLLLILGYFFYLRRSSNITIGDFILLVTLSGIGQFADILIVYMFIFYFDISIEFINLLFIMPLIYFVTVLPISLGGIGVREGAFVFLMTIFGVDSSVAILISFLLYFVKVLIGLIGMFVYLRYKVKFNDREG